MMCPEALLSQSSSFFFKSHTKQSNPEAVGGCQCARGRIFEIHLSYYLSTHSCDGLSFYTKFLGELMLSGSEPNETRPTRAFAYRAVFQCICFWGRRKASTGRASTVMEEAMFTVRNVRKTRRCQRFLERIPQYIMQSGGTCSLQAARQSVDESESWLCVESDKSPLEAGQSSQDPFIRCQMVCGMTCDSSWSLLLSRCSLDT